jgi:hypothetical protein
VEPKTKPAGRSGAPFTAAEWDFSKERVPDTEVVVCCYWEYGRESAFLSSVRERCAEAAHLKLARRELIEFVERDFQKAFSALRQISVFFQEWIYCVDGTAHEPAFVSPFPLAWQSLSEREKAVLVKTATWKVGSFVRCPGFRRAGPARAKALASFQPKPAGEVFGGAWPLPVRDYFHSGSKLRALCPNYIYPNGMEVLAVEIEWGKFTNEQLQAEFAQWLKENEPPGIKRPSGRGKRLANWRAALNRLGIMRNLNRYTFADHRFPKACKERGEKYCYAARKAALGTYRTLFPFLPAGEKPIHWPTKGGRSK